MPVFNPFVFDPLVFDAESLTILLAELGPRFWVRQPYRLWTNRRYINGIIDVNEKDLSDSLIEYTIEGVMTDIKGFLAKNGALDYLQWIDLSVVPILIRRATTYGVAANLWARHAYLFERQLVVGAGPVSAILSQDEVEAAMDYWEGKYEKMLDLFMTVRGRNIIKVSTADQESVFTLEGVDIVIAPQRIQRVVSTD